MWNIKIPLVATNVFLLGKPIALYDMCNIETVEGSPNYFPICLRSYVDGKHQIVVA